MFRIQIMAVGFGSLLGLLSPTALAAPDSGAVLYHQYCARCHGPGRLGAMGPALLPENLVRLREPAAIQTIKRGRVDTQMPAFGAKLNDSAIAALVNYIYTPLPEVPKWGATRIRASRIVYFRPDQLSDKPTYKADMMNLFIVVELGDHHATILDGDTFKPIFRFKTRLNLHGGPKYSPDGRYIYLASRDGWVSKFDLYNLKVVAEVRAGINSRNIAVSADGRYVMVANYLPHTLVALDARDLSLLKVIPVRDRNGRSSRVSAVYTAPQRGSFIAALKDIKEVWELPYSTDAKARLARRGLLDHQNGGSKTATSPDKNLFPIRHIPVSDYLDDFFFDPGYRYLIGASRGGGKGEVLNLSRGRVVAHLALPGMPHLGSGITWMYHGHRVMATPDFKVGVVSVIDMTTWKTIKRIKTDGPGFFLRSHENTPYAWVDVFFGPHRDEEQIIDKHTLKIVKTLIPAPGKTCAHVEFTKDGRYALLSIWDMDGAVVVYDAKTFKEVARIPMKKPSGKYNVWNKTHYEVGTSH